MLTPMKSTNNADLDPFVVGIYIRKSRESSEEAHRLEYQRSFLPQHAKSNGWTYEVYDEGFASAAKGKTGRLQERARLERDIRAGKIQMVLVLELSRLSRDETARDLVEWVTLCADHEVKIATPNRILDPCNDSDWTMLWMESGLSTAEMKRLLTRFAQGRDQAFKKGVWLGGRPPRPYKYDRNLKKPVPDPEQLPRYQKLWQLAENHSAFAVAHELGIPEIEVRRSISDDRLLIFQGKRHHPETGEAITCNWEPVMTQEQADRIKAARRTRKTNEVSRPFAALLSALDLLRCGYCGKTVKTWNNSKRRKDGSRVDYYGCVTKSEKKACPSSRMILQPILDEKVITNVFGTIKALDELIRLFHESQENGGVTGRLNELKRREESLQEKMELLIQSVTQEKVFSWDDIKKAKFALEEEIAAGKKKRDELQSQIVTPPDWESMTLTRGEFDLLDQLDQRRFLKTVLEEITLYRDSALIKYRFPRATDGSRVSRIHLPPPRRTTTGMRTTQRNKK